MSASKKIIVILLGILILSQPLVAGAAAGFCDVGSGVKVPCPISGRGPAGESTLSGLIFFILDIALYVVGSISVLFLIIGGFRYVTAHGNEEQAEGAKKTITHAMIGFIIVVLSFAIITILSNLLVTGAA